MYVPAQYPLPSITGARGTVIPFAPGPCRFNPRTNIRFADRRSLPGGKSLATTNRFAARAANQSVIRRKPTPVQLNGFFDSLVKGITGAAKGFATGGPVGAAVGGGAGLIQGSTGKGGSQQIVQQSPQQSLGPLANVGTGTIVAVSLGFTAFILALSRR